jgi:hypothetical protein
MIGYMTFIASLILNSILLGCLHNQGQNYYGSYTIKIIDFFSYIIVMIVSLIVIFWLLTKYLLYYEIEKGTWKIAA